MQFTIDGINPGISYRKAKDPHSGIVESSQHMREKLAAEGKPVIVSFSRGKDSIAAMVALMCAGVEVVPVHLWRVPDLKFELDSLKYFEDLFQMKIWNLPHRDFWYYLANGVQTAPWQNAIFKAADIQEIEHWEMWQMFREAQGLDDDTWVCDGVRASDSPMRLLSIKRHSPWTNSLRKKDGETFHNRIAHVVWDWKVRDIRKCLEDNQIKLPVDYELWGRTFDGLDRRFMAPMKDKLPEDFEQCRKWFPGVDLEMIRYDLSK